MKGIDKSPEPSDIVVIDADDIEDFAEYGGMLYDLKLAGVVDGRDFQIDNAGDLLMDYATFGKCRVILERHGAKAVG